jgi:hypothetical protein
VDSVAEELERLAALRAKGSLTDAEYDKLKNHLLEDVLTHDSTTGPVIGESAVTAEVAERRGMEVDWRFFSLEEEEAEAPQGGDRSAGPNYSDPPSDQPVAFCEKCGASVNEAARFCRSCGEPLVPSARSAEGGSTAQTPGKKRSSPRRPLTETIGRGIGDTVGYGIRGATGTTFEPAKKAWGAREGLPKWQNIVGTIGLAVNFFSGFGILFILLIYVVQMVSGGRGPGEAFRGLIKGCAWLLIVEIPIVLIVLAVALGGG